MRAASYVKKLTRSKAAGLALITIAVMFFFYLMNKSFFALDNLKGIMNACSLSGTIAVGMACLMMSGSIDLAAGAEGCLGGVIVAILLRAGMPWPVALAITVVCGMGFGLVNAFWCNGLNFMPFIATIGMSSIFQALASIITKSNDIAISNRAFWQLGAGNVWIFPMPFVIMLILMVIYGVMISYTKFGRRMLLCGGNRQAARLAGISPKKITTIMYVNCGAVSAFAGAIMAARMHTGSTRAVIGSEMNAMTAAIIGGVSFLGGGASGMGTIMIALFLINGFNNGLQTIKVNSYWQIVSQGGLLVLALILDYYREHRRLKSLKRVTVKV